MGTDTSRLERRLAKLKKNLEVKKDEAANYEPNVPAHLQIEIKELEEIIAKESLALLNDDRKNSEILNEHFLFEKGYIIADKIGEVDVVLLKGDITKVKANAIVNAANPSLLGESGVSGAILRGGGAELIKACRSLSEKGGCSPGEARITCAGSLPSSYVIHTVGPVWKGGKHNEEHFLKNCYKNSISIAKQYGLKSLIFSSISTGIYEYPLEEAVRIAKETAVENLRDDAGSLKVIGWCLFDDKTFEAYNSFWQRGSSVVFNSNGVNITLYKGDITKISADAIVNTTNPSLKPDVGVSRAISQIGGSTLENVCSEISKRGTCSVGKVRITIGGNLPVKYIIHTVGPVWNGGLEEESDLLTECYKNCITLAKLYELKSLVFPSISTGTFGYPIHEAAEIAKNVLLETIRNPDTLINLGLCLFDDKTFEIYSKVWKDFSRK